MSARLTKKDLSDTITETLPFLRRYARAATGSQKRGDEWVRLCAEVAMQQPELIAQAPDTRLAVFTLFHKLREPFGSLEESQAAPDSVSGHLQDSLTEMRPLQRQMLLLSALEGFSVTEAAHILAIDIASAERCLREAREEMRRRLRSDAGIPASSDAADRTRYHGEGHTLRD